MMNIIKVVENPDPMPAKAFPDKPTKPVNDIAVWETEQTADGEVYFRLANGSAISLVNLERICQSLAEEMKSGYTSATVRREARREERDDCKHRLHMMNVLALQKQAAI